MATDKRFAYTETLNTGEERVMLARLNTVILQNATASVIEEMGRIPGEAPSNGDVPEWYVRLAPSRDNSLLAAYTAQVGLDFVDYNIRIYSMETGDQIAFFNEHRFTDTNRANCSSSVFDDFVAAELAAGVPQATVDGYDFTIIAEGTNIGEPILLWTETGTLLVDYGFDIAVSANSGFTTELSQDRFVFEMSPVDDFQTPISRNAVQPAMAPLPAERFSLGPALWQTGDNFIKLDNNLLSFAKIISWWLPRWLPWLPWQWRPFRWFVIPPWRYANYQRADKVAGYPTP